MAEVFMPVIQDGARVLSVVTGPGVRDARAREDEQQRLARIATNRAAYEGTQYDERNAATAATLVAQNVLKAGDPLPEHKRLHAYSTQIAECVDFIANQLTDGFAFETKDTRVQEVIDRAVQATDKLHNSSDEDIAMDDLMVDAGQAGDVAYETRWDPVEGTAYWELWPAEQVVFDVPHGSWVRSVERTQTIWVEENDPDGRLVEKQVRERVRWDLAYRDADEDNAVQFEPHRECRRRVWWDAEEEDKPRDTTWLGLPFIPWNLLRIDKKGLRGFRGDPLITRKALDNADRYNANEQTAYLIARYNSHGNVVIIGDQAYLKLEQDPLVQKDVADVLRFPGGTTALALTLPTDPTMIEHTRTVTADAMYASFGLTRVEPDTLNGLGGVTGYALEILNRKSEGTMRRVRRQWKTDCLTMLNMALDVTAYREGVVLQGDDLARYFEERPELDVPGGLLPEKPWWDVDPQQSYPNRDIEIRMGSGYVVDDVQVRDDYSAKLISQQEALRERGKSEDQIKQIMQEQREKAQEALEGTLLQQGLTPRGEPIVAPAGQTVEQQPGAAVPAGTQAGKTTGTVQR